MVERTVEGFVENFKVYQNNFHVIYLMTSDEEKIKVVGNPQQKIEENIYYEFITKEKRDKIGKTSLFIQSFKQKQPTDKKNILKILESNFKGVGKKSAEKIYDKFGEESLKIFLKEPKEIYTCDISKKAQDSIFEHFNEMNIENEQLLKMQEIGLSYNEAYEFIMQIQENTDKDVDSYELIQENPYLLREHLKKVGFIKCDFIGKMIGFPKTHPIRVKECMYHILRESEQSGDVCLPKSELLQRMQIFLGLPIIKIEAIINDIEMSQDIEYTYYNQDFYLERNDYIENAIARKLLEIRNYEDNKLEADLDSDILELEEKEREKNPNFTELHPNQRKAIKMVFLHNVSLISGGPGTGKTTILQFVIELSKKYKQTYKICAPTGMASKRMSSSTGERATTMHRALECDMSTGVQKFLKNEDDPLEEKLIIVDECSMIDLFLSYDFLKAVSSDSKLILIGDPDQLPSVGPGKIFEDLIESKLFAHTHLSQIYRQGKNSLIVENAHRINNKEDILLSGGSNFKEDFFFINMSNEFKVREYIKELIQFRLKDSKGYDPLHDIQILSPRKHSNLGVVEVNPILQTALNPKDDRKKELVHKGNLFRVGDKVMQLTNAPEKDIFNGDMGFIHQIEGNQLYVDFSDKDNPNHIVHYEYDEIEQLMLSYSCTVHKSQGSEFKVVIIPIVESDYMMLYKNLIYTAITRGRELVILVGNKQVLENNLYLRKERIRHSNLKARMIEYFNQN